MNKKISSREIRETFLRFFEQKNHLRIPGASVVPADDPTLLFINSGMAPLKKFFVGEATPPASDLCNVQPSIRTRDIDDVGDRHHLTFFEMLGSWSINNYFKERAIELAFELLTDTFGFPPAQLYATVFKGSPGLNLAPDDESARAWEKVGLRRDQIVFLGEDNFGGLLAMLGRAGPAPKFFSTQANNTERRIAPASILIQQAATSRSGMLGCSWNLTRKLMALLSNYPFTAWTQVPALSEWP